MRSRSLRNFPSAPTGKIGWPWTMESAPLSEALPDGAPKPKISIVTPSFNQGEFIEETIRSVLLQGYPNLEYIVSDGGSTDGSVEIIERYAPWLAQWESTPDRGQGHAINKGFARATGEILAYLNSDDIYLPGALHAVAARAREAPEADLLYGGCQIIDREGRKVGKRRGEITSLAEILNLWEVWWARRNFMQPEVFWTRRIAERVGPFREDLFFVLDYDYWLRILAAGGAVARVEKELTAFRVWSNQKTQDKDRVAEELLDVVRDSLWDPSLVIPNRLRRHLQAMWLYHTEFLAEVRRSVAAGDSRLARWPKLAACLARHPKLLLAPGLYERFRTIAGRMVSAHPRV